jgi:hypothetical protein
MAGNHAVKEELKPLKIRCTSADCKNGLHCFLQTQKMLAANPSRRCRSCGAELVDWNRVHKHDLADAAYTFSSLKYELIRHHYWHVEIDQNAVHHAKRKGKVGMQAAAESRIRKSVGPAQPPFDGRQTAKSGNALFYAQHATASCCWKCIEVWHGIPRGRVLSEGVVPGLNPVCSALGYSRGVVPPVYSGRSKNGGITILCPPLCSVPARSQR